MAKAFSLLKTEEKKEGIQLMKVDLEFLDGCDDSIQPSERNGLILDNLPRVGECLYGNGFFHRVKGIVYFEDGGICLHLGKSALSPKQARSPEYGLWNKDS